MPAARNYGLDAARTAGGSAGGAARRPAPVESVVDLHTWPSLTGKMTGKSYGPMEMIIRGLPGWQYWWPASAAAGFNTRAVSVPNKHEHWESPWDLSVLTAVTKLSGDRA